MSPNTHLGQAKGGDVDKTAVKTQPFLWAMSGSFPVWSQQITGQC